MTSFSALTWTGGRSVDHADGEEVACSVVASQWQVLAHRWMESRVVKFRIFFYFRETLNNYETETVYCFSEFRLFRETKINTKFRTYLDKNFTYRIAPCCF